jgi:phage terminase small subunit
LALTKRRQLFVSEHLANPKQPAAWAAVKAGFSEKRARETASELLKDPEIKAAIEHKLTAKLENVEVDQKLVLTGLLRTIERCIEAGSGAWQTAGILKAYELLGRHLKMFTERVELDFSEGIMEALAAGRKRAGLLQPAKGKGTTK